METIFYLTSEELNKLKNGNSITLNHLRLLTKVNDGIKTNVKFHLEKDFARLMINIENNKGFKLNPAQMNFEESQIIEGGNFFKKLGRNIKKDVKKSVNKSIKEVGRELNNELEEQTGFRVNNYGNNIKKLKEYGSNVSEYGIRGGINGAAGAVGAEFGGPAGALLASKLSDTYISKPVVNYTNRKIDGAGVKAFDRKGNPRGNLFVNFKDRGENVILKKKVLKKHAIFGGSFLQ